MQPLGTTPTIENTADRPRQTTATAPDPLSEVLDALHVNAALITCFDFSAPWSVERSQIAGMPFRIAHGGAFWLRTEGRAPLLVESGDIVMLPHGDTHVMSSAPDVQPVRLNDVLSHFGLVESAGPTPGERSPQKFDWGGGGETVRVVAGVVALREMGRVSFLRDLPPVILIKARAQSLVPSLTSALQSLLEEMRDERPGWSVTVRRLTEMVCIQALRAYFAQGDERGGLFAGMRDPKIGRVLMQMHEDPCGDWTVADLASHVHMSRTRFAARFTELVGVGPMTYLSNMRLAAAAEQLLRGQSIAAISREAGYGSEKTFSRAFTQWSGMPPSAYRKAAMRASEQGADAAE